MMMKRLLFHVCLFGSIGMVSGKSLGWGNRGHDALTVVATRLAADKYPDPRFFSPLYSRTEMLAHLANIPDIYWKTFPKAERKLLDSAHFIDLELIDENAKKKQIPVDIHQAFIQAKKICAAKPKDSSRDCGDNITLREMMLQTGSAPWRIKQLSDLMVESFSRAKSFEGKLGNDSEFTKAIDDALFYGGLISHYVGDLSQPLHSSHDYDGYLAGSGGLHYYFEDLLVDQLNFGFYDDVKKYALKIKPSFSMLKGLVNAGEYQPASWAYALALDSHDSLKELFALDQKYAVLKPSIQDRGMNIPAERKNPARVVSHFREFIKKRMAASADLLAEIWHSAWLKAGRPDMSKYKSYEFRLKPDPIPLSYLDGP